MTANAATPVTQPVTPAFSIDMAEYRDLLLETWEETWQFEKTKRIISSKEEESMELLKSFLVDNILYLHNLESAQDDKTQTILFLNLTAQLGNSEQLWRMASDLDCITAHDVDFLHGASSIVPLDADPIEASTFIQSPHSALEHVRVSQV